MPVPVPAHLTSNFRKVKGGVGGTDASPVYYTRYDAEDGTEGYYFNVPMLHQYDFMVNTRETYAFKLPLANIDRLPDYIKNRRDPAFDNEFFLVIQPLRLDMAAFADITQNPVGQVLLRPHYYYHGADGSTDQDANYSIAGDNFNVNYQAGVWAPGVVSGHGNYVNNDNTANALPQINIYSHAYRISPSQPYMNLNVANNYDFNKTLWSFVKGQGAAAAGITNNRNRKNIITLHWVMDNDKFNTLKNEIYTTGAINNLQDLYGQSLALGLLNDATNSANVQTALGM